MPVVAAVVLAAGCSQRISSCNKLLEEIDGKPVLHWVLDAVASSDVQHQVLVTGFQAEQVRHSIRHYSIHTVHNPSYRQGLSTSLRAGIRSLGNRIDAAIIVLADMPDVESEVLNRLIDLYLQTGEKKIIVPVFEGRKGNPVLWPRCFFSELCVIHGDRGGKQLLGTHQDQVRQLTVSRDTIHHDIDTVADLELRQRYPGPS